MNLWLKTQMREEDKGQEYRDLHININRLVDTLGWEINKIKRPTRMMKMLKSSLNAYHDYVNIQESNVEQRYQRRVVELDMKALTKQNKVLADEVAALKADIETAKKESGLFIKFVRKMMGEELK